MNSQFPQQNKVFFQNNRSNILGNLWSTQGIDFQTNLGAIRLAQKLVTNTTSSDDANLGKASAFAYFGNHGWWAILGTRIFNNGGSALLTDGFVVDTSTGAQTTYDSDKSDLVLYNGLLWASLSGKIYSGTGTAWTDRSSVTIGGVTSSVTMTGATYKLLNFQYNNRLYFINTVSTIGSITYPVSPATDYPISVVGDYSLDLTSTGGTIQTMVGTSTRIFISVMQNSSISNSRGQYGSVFEWDGISAQPTNEYLLTTAGLISMCVIDNIPYGIDTEGRFLKFTGNGFEEISRLPINRNLLPGATDTSTTRFVHMNGLVPTKNSTLLVGISNDVNQNQYDAVENISSGIWETDLRTKNVSHRYLFTLKSLSSSTITDFGQNILAEIGAITTNAFTGSQIPGRSIILAGARYYTDASTKKYAVFIDSPAYPTTDNEGQKKGYFVTDWFAPTPDVIEENWTRIWTTYRRFLNSSDSIVFKDRNTEESPTIASITWVDNTHFTTTTDVTAYAANATGFDGTTGGEVEILQGTGSGSCSHITTIVNNAGTYTVTLSSAVTGVTTGTAKARFQKWIKIGTVDSARGLVKSWQQLPISTSNENRIQIKCCMTFTGNGEFYSMIINSSTNVKITS